MAKYGRMGLIGLIFISFCGFLGFCAILIGFVQHAWFTIIFGGLITCVAVVGISMMVLSAEPETTVIDLKPEEKPEKDGGSE